MSDDDDSVLVETEDFLSYWTLEFELNIDGHGLVHLPVFQASAPLTLAEGDILTFQWTILREMN